MMHVDRYFGHSVDGFTTHWVFVDEPNKRVYCMRDQSTRHRESLIHWCKDDGYELRYIGLVLYCTLREQYKDGDTLGADDEAAVLNSWFMGEGWQ